MDSQKKQRVEIFADPWGVKRHHWNTEAKENHKLNLGGP